MTKLPTVKDIAEGYMQIADLGTPRVVRKLLPEDQEQALLRMLGRLDGHRGDVTLVTVGDLETILKAILALSQQEVR